MASHEPTSTWPPLQILLPKPAHYAQLRHEGHFEPVLGHSPEWCSLRVLGLPESLTPEHCVELMLHRAALLPPLSLHHTPLRHASMPTLVKAYQNNSLNPQRKDLIKLSYSGTHAACCTVQAMTSSVTYEHQCFSQAY